MGRLNTPQWTSAQKAAIGDRGHALLLSAAAGSGKTAVLVERAVGLMCQKKDPVPAEALLIVTFTNAAAAELRSRLAKKLNERLAAEPPASPRMHWLRRQQMMLGRAAICTIDAFCLQLLQQNFRALDIPPDFSTADEGTLFTLRANALAETMEAACADEEFCRFADLFGRARSDSGAADAIQRLYAFLRSLPDYRAELERWCRMWEDDTPLEQTALCRAVSELVVEELNSAKWYMEQADERCSEAEMRGMTKLFEKFSPAVSDELDCVKEMLEDFSRGFWDRGVARLRRWKREVVRFTAPRVKADSTDAELKEIVHTVTQKELIVHMRDEANSHIKKLQALELPTSGEYERDRREAAPLVRALARAVLDYDDRLWAAKKEHKVLDFADFEHLALSLLWDGSRVTPLGRQIAAGYQAVMVDEYQDTNRLQDTLYRCLAAPDGSNLFLVGDMKQSIYRFRQADPTVFQEKKRDFRDYRLCTEDPQPDFGVDEAGPARALRGWRIMMNNNFRSAPGVIEAINGIMGEVMTGEVGGVNYRYDHGEQLAQPPVLADYRGGCELCLVDGSSDAGYTAARIREMLNSGFRVRDGGDTRPCRPEDFAILLRSWNGVEEYTAALEENGLRACCNTREDLLDSPVLRPLVNLLRVLDNPAQDVALASVLLSPLGGMTNTELTALRAARPGGSLYRAILPPEEPQTAPPAVENGVQSDPGPRSTAPVTGAEAKAEAFYHWLSGLRDLARTLPVDRLLDEILARTGYAALAGAMPGGEARRDELQRFVDLCCSLGGQGLAELVRRLDALAEQGAVSGSGAVSRPGCVSVMTVHGSKGLEFPVVFYARMSKQFNLQDAAKPVLFHPEWGIGLKLRGPGGTYATLRYVQVARCIRTESISEEMRVFYVALTRAKDRLILSVPVKGGETGKLVQHALEVRRTLSQPRCPGDWAVAAALSNRESGLLQDLLPKEYREAAGCGEWPLEIRMAQEPEAAPELREDTRNAVPDAQLAAALAEGFAWRYPHAVRTGLAAKVSVTGLVHRNDEVHMERPAFMQKDGMTGAEKGTATHAFLQHADLALAGRDLQAEVRRQVELELMAADTAEKLDWPALEHFFQSGLYRRIQQADRVLREYDFISAVPAAALVESDADKAQLDPQRDTVLIQGVADLVLVTGEGVEIVDYKTDRGKSAERLVAAYEKQLRLYARALGRRFSPLPVVKCTIYSFWLRTELDVPLRSL